MEKQQQIRQQAHELLDLVLDTNGLEKRQREKTGAKPTMFFEYFGHVNLINVSCYPDGYAYGANSTDLLRWELAEPLPEAKMLYVRNKCVKALSEQKELEAIEIDIEKQTEIIETAQRLLKALNEKKDKLKGGHNAGNNDTGMCAELYEKYGVTTVFDPDAHLIIHGKEERDERKIDIIS